MNKDRFKIGYKAHRCKPVLGDIANSDDSESKSRIFVIFEMQKEFHRKVQALIRQGKHMNIGPQSNQLEEIIQLVDQPSFLESVRNRDLLGRRIFWNSFVSIVS